MVKFILTIFIALITTSIVNAQDFSSCEIFKNISPKHLNKSIFSNPWDLKTGDTVIIHEEYFKWLKGQNLKQYYPNKSARLLGTTENGYFNNYTYVNPRKPNKDENKFIKNLASNFTTQAIVDVEKLILVNDSGITYDLRLEKCYYQDWFYIDGKIAENEFKRGDYITKPKYTNSQLPYYLSSDPKETANMELSGVIFPSGYYYCNPENYFGEKLFVTKVCKRMIVFKTESNKEIYYYFERNFDFPAFQTNQNLRLRQAKVELKKENLSLLKNVEFTFDDEVYFYYQLKDMFYQDKDLFLVAEKFRKDKKQLSTDTLRYDNTTKYYNFPCYWNTDSTYKAKQKENLELYYKNNFSTKEIEYIRKGQIFIGMSEKALVESLGYPFEGINETVNKRGVFRQYVYDLNRYVYVENGIVTSWDKFGY